MLDQFVLLHNLAYLEKINTAGNNKLSCNRCKTYSQKAGKYTITQLPWKLKHIFI